MPQLSLGITLPTPKKEAIMIPVGYCIQCKQKREIKEGKVVYFKNGTPAEQGRCSGCNSKILRILSKQERQALKEKETGGKVE